MSKGILTITKEVTSVICQHCNHEYIILAVMRDDEGKQDNLWLQAHDYCFNCGRLVDRRSEELDKIRKEGIE